MNKKPKILITNDDSIHSPGIKHLWNALKEHCDITIVAPATEKSGVGLCVTLWDPIHIHKVDWEENTAAWKVTGTPADCVRLATRMILDSPPDLIVSGINRGSNAGRTVLYSGTVAGVIEGVMRNIPGIAFSSQNYDNPNYQNFEKHIYPIVRYVLDHPLPNGSFLNVNFPSSDTIQGFKLTRQGMGLYKEDPDHRTHPDGFSYFWMGGIWESHDEHAESDVTALSEGYIAAAPIYIHELTHHDFITQRKGHFESSLNT
jgi:5'-nucleotidase